MHEKVGQSIILLYICLCIYVSLSNQVLMIQISGELITDNLKSHHPRATGKIVFTRLQNLYTRKLQYSQIRSECRIHFLSCGKDIGRKQKKTV